MMSHSELSRANYTLHCKASVCVKTCSLLQVFCWGQRSLSRRFMCGVMELQLAAWCALLAVVKVSVRCVCVCVYI